jgi:chitinase
VADLEGDAGVTPFLFTVTLSAASLTPVTVAYATADGTATIAGLDYAAASGVLTFSPGGPLTQQIPVDVAGDTGVEPDETFTVTLSGPSGATLQAAVGTGTILNDDLAGPGPEAEIPTLSQWGLALLVASLGLAGLRRVAGRRRRA